MTVDLYQDESFRALLEVTDELGALLQQVDHGLWVNAVGFGEQAVGFVVVAGGLGDQRLFRQQPGAGVPAAQPVGLVQSVVHGALPLLQGP